MCWTRFVWVYSELGRIQSCLYRIISDYIGLYMASAATAMPHRRCDEGQPADAKSMKMRVRNNILFLRFSPRFLPKTSDTVCGLWALCWHLSWAFVELSYGLCHCGIEHSMFFQSTHPTKVRRVGH